MKSRSVWAAMAVLAMVWTYAARAADNELTDQEKADGWVLLFDGKSMDGWVNDKTGQPAPNEAAAEGSFNSHKIGNKAYVPYNSKQKYGDFVLALDFKVSKGCNSGVFIRLANPKDPVMTGFEIQVFDSFGKEKPDKHDMGALYDALEPSKNACKPAGEWQHLEITAKGNRITVVQNGQQIVDADLDKWTEAGKNPDGTKNKYKTAYKDMAKEGYIGVQDHGHDCWYKNVKVKVLK